MPVSVAKFKEFFLMLSNRLAFAALGVACIAAATAGGYLASRQNAAPPAAVQRAAAPTPDRSAQPVQETEAVVGNAKTPATEIPAPTAAPKAAAPVTRRVEPPARPSTARDTRTARNEPLPALTSPWPNSAATSAPSAVATPAPVENTPAPRVEERPAAEPPRAPEPPQKVLEELVVSVNSVIGLQIETPITSERARVEDRVEARVTRDVKVGDRVAVPAGARAVGSVTLVEKGGKFKERARLGIRFHTLVLADGTRLPIQTDTIYRDGEAPGNSSAAKVGGGAVAGAILGAILGGGKGAAVGAAAGAGGGAAAVEAGDRKAATIHAGEAVTARILQPVTVTIEK
ncbi:MAG: hypothetical protein HY047_10755 [Acidobacteria bacterium]|nr:hypothetical protein [Acidobacteriota bacterium]